jgi:hypothetical protein
MILPCKRSYINKTELQINDEIYEKETSFQYKTTGGGGKERERGSLGNHKSWTQPHEYFQLYCNLAP